MGSFKPVIKWSGSKRSQSEMIVSEFSKTIKTYHEPFVGGGSVLMELLLNNEITVENYECSDLNQDLINLWNEIKNNPLRVCSEYEKLWNEMNCTDDKEFKKKFFNSIRSRFNTNKSPYDFMFIMRTTTNGMPRYNQKGEFNNSFHVTRNGIKPDTLSKIVLEWSDILNRKNVNFTCKSYDEIITREGDLIYLDPPYANTKGMYYGAIDYDVLWNWLKNQKATYLLSFDGISGEVDSTYSVPKEIYTEHKYLRSGNSSFKRTIGKSNDSVVFESLYIK